MKNLKKLIVGFALAAGAAGAMAADKAPVCTDDGSLCAKEMVADQYGSPNKIMKGITVKDIKTGRVCTADRGTAMMDAQGKIAGYVISNPKCGK